MFCVQEQKSVLMQSVRINAMTALCGGLNRSMQHFILKYLRGGVDNEIQNSDLLH